MNLSRITAYLFMILLCQAPGLTAQPIPLGTWRSHLSYQSISTLAVAGDRVYGASSGGLFSVDPASATLTKLSKLDGFSEADITRIAYQPALQTLLVAYGSGNVDLLTTGPAGDPDRITNVSVIRNAAIQGSKRINDVTFRNNLAYLSCDFGLVVLDIPKREVRETYRNIGFNGQPVAVFASTFTNDSIFLASSQGVMAASLSAGANLQDFSSWKTFTSGIPVQNVKAIASRGDRVYAGVSQEGLFVYQDNQWTNLLALATAVSTIRQSNNQLLVSTANGLFSVDENNGVTAVTDNLLASPQEATFDAGGKLWVADASNGLLSNRSGPFEATIPDGPASNRAWKLFGYEDKILALSGGYDDLLTPFNRTQGFYTYDGTDWNSFNSRSSPPLPEIRDLVTAAYDPARQQLYLGSYGDGLYVRQRDGTIAPVTDSPLVATAAGVRVTGLALDADGNLWVTQGGVASGKPSLHVRKKDDTWQSFAFPQTAARNPLGLLVDGNGYIWLRLSPTDGGGILVFDEKNSQSRYLTTAFGNGELPNSNVRSMALDQEGQVWVGTDDGAAVFANTAGVFSGNVAAFTPIFNARPLLNDESITTIAIDGGNRKWMGTRNGLWLFNPDGSKQLENFTSINSPLLSDSIADVRVEPVTGEVFMATDKGILSYRGTATEVEPTHTNVKVFPNPVRPNFDGLVGISGLAANSTVKITDVAGRLVFEARTNGGTASWNVRDYNGRRAETGIYLIFSANEDGSETFVTKLAVVK